MNVKSISVNLTNINIEQPYYTENNGCSKIMTPYIARLRNLTYSLTVLVNVEISIVIMKDNNYENLPVKIIENIILAKIPIVVKSKYCTYKKDISNECSLDPGGYYIINGNEKVLITQEKITPNIIQVYAISKNASKYSIVSEIRSSNDDTYGITKTISIKYTDKQNLFDNKLFISLPHIKQDIPIFIIFRALGCISDKEMVYYIIDNDDTSLNTTMMKMLEASLLEVDKYRTEYDSLKYMSKHLNNSNNSFTIDMKINYCKNIIQKEYLPHLHDNESKLYFTGLMVNKLFKCYLKINKPSDRDSYFNKRLEPCGVLLGNLTIQAMNKVVKDMKNYITKEINSGVWSINNNYNDIINEINITKIIKQNYIENILKGALATGNWGLKTNTNKQGVSQVLNRLTFMSTLSHLRRISTPVDSTGKLIPPRKLHSTQWGYICPTETPEGQSVGVVKNLSMMCEITDFNPTDKIYSILDKYIIHFKSLNIFEYNKLDFTKIFINGNWIGYVLDPEIIVKLFKENRNKCLIHPHNSIHWDILDYSIYIFTDRGRCIRPLLKISDKLKYVTNKDIQKLTWSELLLPIGNDIIEYIDTCEINNSLILMDHTKINFVG